MSIWWDKSMTLVEGCTPVSAGCDHCWSAGRTNHWEKKKGYTDGPHFNGKILFREDRLQEILKRKKPTKWTIWNDLFHPDVTFEQIDKVFEIIMQCPQHIFMILTKRSVRMKQYFDVVKESQARCGEPSPFPLPNVHHGVTVENQDNVGRIADLIQTPAAKRFLSIEPLLPGILDLASVGKPGQGDVEASVLDRHGFYCGIDYIFIGCESGPKARLCSLDDIHYLMHQCRNAGVKIHVKQIPLNGKCNKRIDEWPPEFQIREV